MIANPELYLIKIKTYFATQKDQVSILYHFVIIKLSNFKKRFVIFLV